MHYTTKQYAEFLLVTQSVIWGLFPIVTILAVNTIHPLLAAGIANLIATIIFAITLSYKKKWKELKQKSAWKDILLATFIVGIFYYSLNFISLQYTSAGNQAILLLTEIGFSFFFFGFILKTEKITKQKIIGAILMSLGAGIIIFQNTTQLNIGDLFVVLGTSLVPLGNFYAKRAITQVSSTTLMFIRSLISGIILSILGILLTDTLHIQDSLFLLTINGVFIFGISKIMWLEAIKRVDISHAVIFFPVSAAFSLIFAYIFLGEIPTTIQILGFLPITIGLFILTASPKTISTNQEL